MQETQEMRVWSLDWEDSMEEGMKPTLVSLAGETHRQKSLAGYRPWGREELDTTEAT